MASFIGTGTTITFSSGWFAEILDVVGPTAAREAIQTSHMGTTTAHTFMPADLVDWGELTVEAEFNANTDPPTNAAAETVTITFPNGSTWAFSGFMTGFEARTPFEDRMTATTTIKIAGDVTVSGGS